MPVSTRRMIKVREEGWPPARCPSSSNDAAAGADDDVLLLPTDLYWNHIRPYTPLDDRVLVSKRCTTRFYAGDRVAITDALVQQHIAFKMPHHNGASFRYPQLDPRAVHDDDDDDEGPPRALDGEVTIFTGIPRTEGEPGTHDFRISFRGGGGGSAEDLTDPAVALELLHKARSAWDAHISHIHTPSGRLQVCLEILHHDDGSYECPLLFPGEGKLKDVIDFHVGIDPRCLNGPCLQAPNSLPCVPNTQLGYWVTQFLGQSEEDLMCEIFPVMTDKLKAIVAALLDAGADVGPFFVSMSSSSCSEVIEPGNGWGRSYTGYLRYYPWMSLHKCMEMYSKHFEAYGGFDNLDWLISLVGRRLEEKKGTANVDN